METALTPALGAAAQNITAEEFDALVRRHQRRVHRLLLMLLRDPDEADNLTSRVLPAGLPKHEQLPW